METLVRVAADRGRFCNGGRMRRGANANKANANPGTTPGNYTVTVTGVAGATMATTPVTVKLN